MKTIECYDLEELKPQHPDAYARVLKRWADSVAQSPYTPWADEIMASLRAMVGACGAKLTDWSIGPWSPCYLSVDFPHEHPADYVTWPEEFGTPAEWLFREVLAPLGYVKDAAGAVQFPGLCPLTGYCADEDFIEHLYNALVGGESLPRALCGLARKAGEMMEEEIEYRQGEEEMMANWGGRHFTAAGVPVD